MEAAQFPASAANSLINGYGEDFASLAAILKQTLEQVCERSIRIDESRPALEGLEQEMRDLAGTIHMLLSGKKLATASTASAADAEATTAADTSGPAKEPESASLPRLLTRPKDAKSAETLRGNNQSMPLLSVCQFIGRMRKSGMMHVSILDEELTFEFADGCVQRTTSSGCPANERTGEILVSMGFCSDADIAPLLKTTKKDEFLGDKILKSGIVSHGQLLEALERQVQLRFARACKTVLTSYRFEEGTCAPTDGRIHITPLELAWHQKTDL